jgi:chemotaxis signal transduction protein
VGFSVGGCLLAVEAARVTGVVRARGIIPVPFARSAIPGVLVREGRLVPVLDLARVPGVWNEVPGGAGDQVVLVRSGEVEAGILGAAMETLAGAAPAAGDGREGPGAAHPPAGVREGILSGALSAGGRAYGILKVEAALAAAGLPGN